MIEIANLINDRKEPVYALYDSDMERKHELDLYELSKLEIDQGLLLNNLAENDAHVTKLGIAYFHKKEDVQNCVDYLNSLLVMNKLVNYNE